MDGRHRAATLVGRLPSAIARAFALLGARRCHLKHRLYRGKTHIGRSLGYIGNISTVGSSITEWKTRDTLNSNYADNYLVAGYYFFGGLPELANFYYSGFSGAWPSMRYVYSATVPAPFVHVCFVADTHTNTPKM